MRAAILIFVCCLSLPLWAGEKKVASLDKPPGQQIKLTVTEKEEWLTRFYTVCVNTKDDLGLSRSAPLCRCIGTNNVALAERKANKTKALGQLKWVKELYAHDPELTDAEFENDYYEIAGYHGGLFLIDNGCKESEKKGYNYILHDDEG